MILLLNLILAGGAIVLMCDCIALALSPDRPSLKSIVQKLRSFFESREVGDRLNDRGINMYAGSGKKLAALGGLAIITAIALGCAGHHSNVPNTIPAVGGNLEKTEAHVESGDRLVIAAKKYIAASSAALLDTAHTELGEAINAVNGAKADLTTVQHERDTLVKQGDLLASDLSTVKHGWGFRLQSFVHRTLVLLAWLIGSAVFLHFALGLGGLFVAGPAGAIMARAGAVINPFAWFQTIRDNIHFNRQLAGK